MDDECEKRSKLGFYSLCIGVSAKLTQLGREVLNEINKTNELEIIDLSNMDFMKKTKVYCGR